jgi:organic radical activating enzyme
VSNKLVLPFLETMITQVCNLSCTGCTNYSDLPQRGYVTWEQGRKDLTAWLERLYIPDFGIMGGEPLINPECLEWLQGVRELMPDSQIRFTTNGLLLHRWPGLVDHLHNLGNVSFKITVHHSTPELEHTINDIFDKYAWKPVYEHGIQRWITNNSLRFHVKRPETFIKTYRNNYSDMMPWDSDPDTAFSSCVQQTCPLLHQGHIYKCSTSGLLAETLMQQAPHNLEYWNKYIVPGLVPNCTDEQLQKFIDNFGKSHGQCGQCPTAGQHCQIDHKSSIVIK